MNCASRPPAQQQQQQTLGLLSAHISSAHVFLDASTRLRKSVSVSVTVFLVKQFSWSNSFCLSNNLC